MRFRYPSDWNSELERIYQNVQNIGTRVDRNELDYATAVNEFRLAAFDVRPYSSHDHEVWQSILADLRRAFEWLGPDSSSLVTNSHESLRRAIHQLPWGDNAAMQAQRRSVGQLTQEILDQLISPRGTVFAWRDLTRAVDEHSSYVVVCRLRDVFASITTLRGYDVESFGYSPSEIGDVLADNAPSVRILSNLANIQSPEFSADPESMLAGLSRESRFDFVEKFLTAPIPEPGLVVWLIYKHALMANFEQTAGQVTLFRGDWFLELVRSGAAPKTAPIGREIASFGSEVLRVVEDEDASSGIVVARVNVGNRTRSTAEFAARTMTEVLIAASLGPMKRPGWTYTGARLVVENQTFSQASWKQQDDNPKQFWDEAPPVDLSVSREWIEHGLGRSLKVDEDLTWTLDAIGGLTTSNATSPSARLTLAVQAIERVNATSVNDENWAQFAKSYLRDWWIVSEIVWNLQQAIAQAASPEALFASDFHSESPEARRAVGALYSLNRSGAGKGSELVASGIDLLGTLAPDSHYHSKLKWSLRACSASKAAAMTNLAGDQFDHMIARCRRYRNASAHGSAQSRQLIEWCADFASRIAGRALSWKLVAHLRGDYSASTIVRLAEIERWRCAEISQGRISESFGPPPGDLLLR